MNLGFLTSATKRFGRSLNRNSPTIFTSLGVAGLIGTVAMAIRATGPALEAIAAEENYRLTEVNDPKHEMPITPVDVVELTWRFYVPTVLMGVSTAACIIASNSINLRRNAALVGLLTAAETTLKEYQKNVVEQIGEKKEEKVRDAMAEKILAEHPMEGRQIYLVGSAQTRCYDAWSDRYFNCDVETIRKVQNAFNARLLCEMMLPINDFYSDLGLPPAPMGADIGWNIEHGMMDLSINGKLMDDNTLCVVLQHRNQPTKIW